MSKQSKLLLAAAFLVLVGVLGFWFFARDNPPQATNSGDLETIEGPALGIAADSIRQIRFTPGAMADDAPLRESLPATAFNINLRDESKELSEFFARSPAEQEAALDKAAQERGSASPIVSDLELDIVSDLELNEHTSYHVLIADGDNHLLIRIAAPRASGQDFGVDENGKNPALERNKRQIDQSSPTLRAQRDEYQRRLQERLNRNR